MYMSRSNCIIQQVSQRYPSAQARVPVDIFQQRKQAFIDELKTLPIALHTDTANEQHYEVRLGHEPVTAANFSSSGGEQASSDPTLPVVGLCAQTHDMSHIQVGICVQIRGASLSMSSKYKEP